jgi:hypothetical protein
MDGATLTFRTDDNEWPAGSYTLTLDYGAEHASCTFSVPDDLPENGSVGVVTCTQPWMASLNYEVMCVEHRNGDSVGQSCTPIPDQYYLSVTLSGTPDSVTVLLERDDEPLLEETHALSYAESRPNGPECDPLCRQASVEIRVP